jgi:hypothetical protein
MTPTIGRVLIELGILERRKSGFPRFVDEETKRHRHCVAQTAYRQRLAEAHRTGEPIHLKRGRPKKYNTVEELQEAQKRQRKVYVARHKQRIKEAIEHLIEAANMVPEEPTSIDKWCIYGGSKTDNDCVETTLS